MMLFTVLYLTVFGQLVLLSYAVYRLIKLGRDMDMQEKQIESIATTYEQKYKQFIDTYGMHFDKIITSVQTQMRDLNQQMTYAKDKLMEELKERCIQDLQQKQQKIDEIETALRHVIDTKFNEFFEKSIQIEKNRSNKIDFIEKTINRHEALLHDLVGRSIEKVVVKKGRKKREKLQPETPHGQIMTIENTNLEQMTQWVEQYIAYYVSRYKQPLTRRVLLANGNIKGPRIAKLIDQALDYLIEQTESIIRIKHRDKAYEKYMPVQ